MRFIAFITDNPGIDRIINHFKLTFTADEPPPPDMVYQETLMVAETEANIFHDPHFDKGGGLGDFRRFYAFLASLSPPFTIFTSI